MNETINYYVIGGQHEPHYYGGTPTLVRAFLLATKSKEHWDNCQELHMPDIYPAEDTVEVEARGLISHRDGEMIRIPKDGAVPIGKYPIC